MGEKLITWGDIHDDFILHYPKLERYDYRPYKPYIVYIWLKNGREITYNYKTKRIRYEKRGTWERWFERVTWERGFKNGLKKL